MKSPVRRSVKLRSRPRPRRVGRVGLLEDQPLVGTGPAWLDALQVVGRALAAAAVGPGDERRVARADELLQLGLGLAQAAGGDLRRLGAELDRLRARDGREPQRPAGLELGEDAVGLY